MTEQEEPGDRDSVQGVERRRSGGRPRKFAGPSRPVTVTLSEATIERLRWIHEDRALAIAKAAEIATETAGDQPRKAEVIEIAEGQGLILVGPSMALKRIPWLRMVQISPARFLLSIPTGTSVDSLEIAILDLIDHLAPEEADERDMLVSLRDIMRTLRHGHSVSKAEILIVKTRA